MAVGFFAVHSVQYLLSEPTFVYIVLNIDYNSGKTINIWCQISVEEETCTLQMTNEVSLKEKVPIFEMSKVAE